MQVSEIKTILISRTDSIGDVILSLPLASIIKRYLPEVKILFLGSNYTKAIVNANKHVDQFIDYTSLSKLPFNEQVAEIKALNIDAFIHVFPRKALSVLAKKAKIPMRIGTARRVHTCLHCNYRVNFTRRNSELHESQLNIKLLTPLGIKIEPTLEEVATHVDLTEIEQLDPELLNYLDKKRGNLVIHPKSQGSAVEWGLSNYRELIEKLPKDQFKIFITGTESEGLEIRKKLRFSEHVVDLTGKMSLPQLVSFLKDVDIILAASTGPLHIGAAHGIHAVGLYSPRRPIHPGRWKPLGIKAQAIVNNEDCNTCARGKPCECIKQISSNRVKTILLSARKES